MKNLSHLYNYLCVHEIPQHLLWISIENYIKHNEKMERSGK